MVSKKAQSKAGIPPRRRGQQMGDERSQPSKTDEAKRETPAMRGRRKSASKFFADESSQVVGSGGEAPSAASPSTPAAIPRGMKLGESGGERVFKRRQASARSSKRR
jgi:hypothetical protein